jgi:hypothetical protein
MHSGCPSPVILLDMVALKLFLAQPSPSNEIYRATNFKEVSSHVE